MFLADDSSGPADRAPARLNGVFRVLRRLVARPLVALFYREIGFATPTRVLVHHLVPQKILGRNRAAYWPVHPTSTVLHPDRITLGRNTLPGIQPGNYIQAANGIEIGSDVRIAPGVGLISANHDADDFGAHIDSEPIRIGSHVWIGMNTVVLPGVEIGSNVIIGAGSVVTKSIPSNTVAAGNPCRVIRDRPARSA